MACNHFYLQSTKISESLEFIVFFISFIILGIAFPLVSDLCFWQFTHFVNNNLKGMEQNHYNSGQSSNQPQNWNHTSLTTYFFEVTYIFKVCTHVHAQRFTPQITSTGDSTNGTLSNLFYAVHALGRFFSSSKLKSLGMIHCLVFSLFSLPRALSPCTFLTNII
jgi:hypothetical protein